MCWSCDEKVRKNKCENKIVKSDCGYNTWAENCKEQHLPKDKWCTACKGT